MPGRSREGADAEPGRFLALDSLRGIAAVGVALFHIQAVAGPSTLPVFRNGNLFVDFFFVLSGFVIAASYGERLAHGFGMARYMALRVGRVWPLHLFMVGAYLALELVSVAIGSFGLAPGAPFTGTHSLGHLFTGIFLLDGYIPERGNFYSGAGWSISVELLLYVLAALAFRRGRTGLALLFALGGIALAARIAGIDWPLFTRAVQRGLAGFAAGTACWLLHQHLRARRLPLPGLAEVAALASLFAFLWFAERHDYSALVVLPAALTVQVFAREEGALSRMLRGWGWGWLGRLSYAMFLTRVGGVDLAGPQNRAHLGHLHDGRQRSDQAHRSAAGPVDPAAIGDDRACACRLVAGVALGGGTRAAMVARARRNALTPFHPRAGNLSANP